MPIFDSGGGGGHNFGPPAEYGGRGGRGNGSGRNPYISGGAMGAGNTGSSYRDYNNTIGSWNNSFGGSPLDYTSSNTAAGGRMQAEYLGGAGAIQGSNLKMIANYIYFYHLDRFCVIPLYPESINDNITFAQITCSTQGLQVL